MRETTPNNDELSTQELSSIVDNLLLERPYDIGRLILDNDSIYVDDVEMPKSRFVEIGEHSLPLESFILSQLDK